MSDPASLRSRIRALRRALTPTQRLEHAARMAAHLRSHPAFLRSRHIACYLAVDGEMDPAPLMSLALDMGKKVYLPVLVPFCENRLWFAPYEPGCKMQPNRFGIPEPAAAARHMIRANRLDLVLTPLVAFDPDCNRLGMGGGYYDRSFSFLCRRRYWKRPRLLGLAHELQRLPRLVPQPWDVPLYAVATEAGIYQCQR